MNGLEGFRAQYPQYDDISDQDLALRLHKRYYKDMDLNDFFGRLGVPLPEPEVAARGNILPFRRYSDGRVEWDVLGEGMTGAMYDAFTLPGDVTAGRVDPKSDEAIERSFNLAMMATPANPGIRAGDAAIPGAVRGTYRKAKVDTPSVDDLMDAADAGYDFVRKSGVDYSSDSITSLARRMSQQLQADGFLDVEGLAPSTHNILKKLGNAPDGAVAGIQGVESARRAFSKIATTSTNPTERAAAYRVVRELSEFIQDPPTGSVLAGPADDAGRALADARGNYAAAKRGQRINETIHEARLDAQTANSGTNTDNRTRAISRQIRKANQRKHAFNPEEVAALEDVQRGGFFQNRLRDTGNLLGGGGGPLGAMVATGAGALGYGVAGPLGATVGTLGTLAAGRGTKALAGRMSQGNLRDIGKMTRQRSPLYRQRVEQAPTNRVRIPPERQLMILRMLGLTPKTPSSVPAKDWEFNPDTMT